MKTQNDRLLAALKSGQSVTALDALRDLPIFRLAARVRDLRDEGIEIRAEWQEVQNRFGEKCRVKRYWLAVSAA